MMTFDCTVGPGSDICLALAVGALRLRIARLGRLVLGFLARIGLLLMRILVARILTRYGPLYLPDDGDE